MYIYLVLTFCRRRNHLWISIHQPRFRSLCLPIDRLSNGLQTWYHSCSYRCRSHLPGCSPIFLHSYRHLHGRIYLIHMIDYTTTLRHTLLRPSTSCFLGHVWALLTISLRKRHHQNIRALSSLKFSWDLLFMFCLGFGHLHWLGSTLTYFK